MQFDDPKSILERAAATPVLGIDPHTLIRAGHRLRRIRLAAAGAGMAVVVGAASAAFGVLGGTGSRDPRTLPAAPSPDRCREAVGRISYEFVGEEAATARAQAEALEALLRRQVRYLRRNHAEASEAALGSPTGPGRRGTERALERAEKALREAMAKARGDVRTRTAPDGLCIEPTEPSKEGPAFEDARRASSPSRVAATLEHAECSVDPPDSVDSPPVPGEHWCTFEVVIENHGTAALTFDDDARLLLVGGARATTYTTAYFEGGLAPKLVDLRLGPGEAVTTDLVFVLDAGQVPVNLLLRSQAGDRVVIPFDYDCAPDLRDEPGGTCAFSGGAASS